MMALVRRLVLVGIITPVERNIGLMNIDTTAETMAAHTNTIVSSFHQRLKKATVAVVADCASNVDAFLMLFS